MTRNLAKTFAKWQNVSFSNADLAICVIENNFMINLFWLINFDITLIFGPYQDRMFMAETCRVAPLLEYQGVSERLWGVNVSVNGFLVFILFCGYPLQRGGCFPFDAARPWYKKKKTLPPSWTDLVIFAKKRENECLLYPGRGRRTFI